MLIVLHGMVVGVNNINVNINNDNNTRDNLQAKAI